MPPDYRCPFCLLASGIENEYVWSRTSDIIYRDAGVMAFIAAGQWPTTPGHVLVVPVKHFENLYDLPDELGAALFSLTRRVALAMKAAYGCEGTSTRQHNEPGGGQDVWHFHTHVFPRWSGDRLYDLTAERHQMDPARRAVYADQLRPLLLVSPAS